MAQRRAQIELLMELENEIESPVTSLREVLGSEALKRYE